MPLTADERLAHLRRMSPGGPASFVAQAKQHIIERVLRVEYKSRRSDASLMTIGVGFAVWCMQNNLTGDFDPERDFTGDNIDDFARLGVALQNNSTGTYKSQLKRLATPEKVRRRSDRPYAQAPYGIRRAEQFVHAAIDLQDVVPALGRELRTLTALGLGGGLAGAEIHAITARDVLHTGRRVSLQVVKNHFIREVPLRGAAATWLLTRSRNLSADEHLFRPGYATRGNATWDLIDQVKKHDLAFAGYKNVRARHTWIVKNLCAGVPFHAVCAAAGIGRDANLPTDLLPYMPNLTPQQVAQAFEIPFSIKEES